MLVFVYGTLTDPDRVDAVVDDWSFAGAAVLEGLVRADGRYPTLVPPGEGERADAGAQPRVEGRLLRTQEVDALDAYEGVDRGLYVRAPVPLAAQEGTASVYVGDPGRLGVDPTWPGEGSLAERVRRYVDDNGVAVRFTGD